MTVVCAVGTKVSGIWVVFTRVLTLEFLKFSKIQTQHRYCLDLVGVKLGRV